MCRLTTAQPEVQVLPSFSVMGRSPAWPTSQGRTPPLRLPRPRRCEPSFDWTRLFAARSRISTAPGSPLDPIVVGAVDRIEFGQRGRGVGGNGRRRWGSGRGDPAGGLAGRPNDRRSAAPTSPACSSTGSADRADSPGGRPAGTPPRARPQADEGWRGPDSGADHLRGAGGFGKTTLAAEVCRKLKDRFPDGIFWCTVGQQLAGPDLAGKINDLAFWLSSERPTLVDPEQAGHHRVSSWGAAGGCW